MTKGWRPRKAPPHPRLRAAAESAKLQQRRNDREEISYIKSQGRPREATPRKGVVAAWVQEGLEELLHIQGQEGRQ